MFNSVRRVGRVAVFALLAWTAADVLNPALCGLDEFPFVAAGMAVAPGGGAPADPPPIPAEDCFCCSHNVNFSAMVHVEVSPSEGSEPRQTLVQNPSWTSFPLYHPPRLLS